MRQGEHCEVSFIVGCDSEGGREGERKGEEEEGREEKEEGRGREGERERGREGEGEGEGEGEKGGGGEQCTLFGQRRPQNISTVSSQT